VLIGGSNQILKTEDVAEGLVFELIVGRSIETVVQLIDFVAIGSTETFALTNGHSPAFRYQSRSVLPHAEKVGSVVHDAVVIIIVGEGGVF